MHVSDPGPWGDAEEGCLPVSSVTRVGLGSESFPETPGAKHSSYRWRNRGLEKVPTPAPLAKRKELGNQNESWHRDPPGALGRAAVPLQARLTQAEGPCSLDEGAPGLWWGPRPRLRPGGRPGAW